MELRGAVENAVREGRAVDVPALLAGWDGIAGGRENAAAIIADETARAKAERAERERQAEAEYRPPPVPRRRRGHRRNERGGTPGPAHGPRVRIQANDRQLPEITAEAVAALRAWNDPPSMFIRAGELVRIDPDEHGRPVIRPVLDHQVRWALGEAADFVAAATDHRGTVIRPAIPPMPVARNILSSAHLCSWFPPLLGLIGSPAICLDGRLVTAPGYDPGTGLYYSPGAGLDLPPVPDDPTPEEVADAAAFVCDVVADFPFVENDGAGANRANAVAALMTPIVRPMIAGRVPMLLLDKPQMGTGASLLAELIVTIATGSSAAMTQAPTSRDEWGKLLLAELSAGRAVIVFDNLTGVLSSSDSRRPSRSGSTTAGSSGRRRPCRSRTSRAGSRPGSTSRSAATSRDGASGSGWTRRTPVPGSGTGRRSGTPTCSRGQHGSGAGSSPPS